MGLRLWCLISWNNTQQYQGFPFKGVMASLLYFSGTMLYLSASDSEAVNQVEFAFLSMFLLLLIADIKQGKKLTICFFFFFWEFQL